jgi:hypothetical protein
MVVVPSTVAPAQIQKRVRGLGRPWSLRVLQFLEEALSESPGRDQRETNKFERTTVALVVGESLLLADRKVLWSRLLF